MWCAAAVLAAYLLQTTDFSAEGLKALEAEKYEEAAEHFNKAVEADPEDYYAQFHLALAYSLLDRDTEAIPAYKKVLELKPDLYQAELNLGILLLRRNQAGEAAPYLEAAARRRPKEFRPVFYLAEALYTEGLVEKAEEAYTAAAEIDPNSASAQLGLARCKARREDINGAADHFLRTAQLDAEFKDVLLELAALYEQQGQKAEAAGLYEQFPENVGARERLGEILMEIGRPEEAIPHLEWAVRASPTPANRAVLAAAYLKTDRAEEAVSFLEQAVAAEPGNLDLRMMYGRALRDQHRRQEAAAEFWRVAQARPDSAAAWSELAGVLILLENYPQALAALDRVRDLNAETAGHHFFRAIILDKTRQYRPALESYEKFLAASQGKNPDEEFQARQRVRIIQKELNRR